MVLYKDERTCCVCCGLETEDPDDDYCPGCGDGDCRYCDTRGHYAYEEERADAARIDGDDDED